MRTFTVHDAPQRSDEWFAARLGCLTASRAADMLSMLKSGTEGAERRNLRVQLVVERLTGRPAEDGYVSDDMLRGTELEPEALAAHEALTGNVARSTGFLRHVTHAAGCSLDGDVDDFAGIVELKVPKSATHWGYLRGGKGVPARYLPQVTHALWITGAAYCDFLSFDPRFPPKLRTFWVRHERDEQAIEAYEAKALAFLQEVDHEVTAAHGWDVIEQEAISA